MSEQQQAQQVNKLNINDVFQALGTAMTDAHLANLARTEATVGSLQQSLKAKDKEINALREEIESINKQKDNANELCKEKDTEINGLRKEIESINKQKDDANDLCKEKDTEITALCKEIESINKQKDDANERCEEKNKEILKLERENCKMRDDFDNYFKTQRALSNLPESSTD